MSEKKEFPNPVSFKKLFKYIFLIILVFGAFQTFGATGGVTASATCSSNNCATLVSDSTKINFGCTNCNFEVSDSALTGYAWSEIMGWIKFNPSGGYGGVSNTTAGVLSGYAWGQNAGWINFNCDDNGGVNCVASDHFKVSVNPSTGDFSGYAWSQNYGWINFSGLNTSWRPTATGGGDEDTRTFCEKNPSDPSCDTRTFCEKNPSDPSCDTRTFCEKNPTDPTCDTRTFCEKNPTDSSCIIIPPPDETCSDGIKNQDETGVDTGGVCGGDDEEEDTGDDVVIPDPIKDFVDNVGHGISKGVDKVLNTLPPSIQKDLNTGAKAVVSVTKTTAKAIAKVVDSPTGKVVTEAVTSVGVVSGATISVASALFISPLSFSELFLIPVRLWGLLMAALGFRKRNKPWGTVYDSVTKQPLDPAYVIVQDLNGNEVATSITDLDGRYGFLIPPGKYRLLAHKTNYEFPSIKLVGKDIDEIYTDLYFDQIVEITDRNSVITKNIPMDPLKFDWNEFAKKQQNLMKFYSKRDIWVTRIADLVFYFGFIVTAVVVLTDPKIYNIATFTIYIILFALKHTVLKPRPNGTVKEKGTKIPLSFAVVHVYSADMSREIVHKVADKTGKFYCLVPNGTYGVKIERKNTDESYTEVYSEQGIVVKDGFINTRFEI